MPKTDCPAPPDPEYYIFANDPVFANVSDRSVPIWRYMDIAKFMSLIDKRALFFARLDNLGDPFEGSLTRRRQLDREELEDQHIVVLYRDSGRLVESKLVNTIVNCWHMNEIESFAMWNLYAPNNQGVAIHSTIDRLIRSFQAYEGEYPQQEGYWLPKLFVKIGIVEYIDYEHYDGVGEEIYLLKRRSFEHERELRAIVEDESFTGDPHPDDPRFHNGGDYVPCAIETLIKDIYVPPGAPTWFRNTITSVVKKYGYDFPVKQSVLDREPLR